MCKLKYESYYRKQHTFSYEGITTKVETDLEVKNTDHPE